MFKVVVKLYLRREKSSSKSVKWFIRIILINFIRLTNEVILFWASKIFQVSVYLTNMKLLLNKDSCVACRKDQFFKQWFGNWILLYEHASNPSQENSGLCIGTLGAFDLKAGR